MTQPLQIIKKICMMITIICLIAISSNHHSALASDQLTELTLSPAKTTPSLKKGETYNGEFTVYNSGEADIKVKVSAQPYDSSNNGYKLSLSNDRSLIHNWIKFKQQEITIKARSNAVVPYVINTPKDIPDGGQYGLISVETINNHANQSSGVATVLRLNMLVYASTNGENRYEGAFKDINIPLLHIGSGQDFSFKATNTGNTHYEISSDFTISDVFGNQKFSMQKTDVVLPSVDKKIEFKWDRSPIIALVKVQLKANGLNQKIDHTKTVLFISPVFFIILITIIIILGATYVANKKFKYKYQR